MRAATLLLALCSIPLAGFASAADLLVRDVRVFDGRGETLRGPVDVWVAAGRVAAIARGIDPPRGAPVLDGRGLTLLPGLVDAHVHLALAPGQRARADDADTRVRLLRRHLSAYLACGVTTVLDAGASARAVAEVRGVLASGAPGPRVLFVGTPLTAAGGYGKPDALELAQADDVVHALDALAGQDVVAAKLLLERGWNPLGRLPLPSPAVRARLREELGRRRLPLLVHALTEETQALALELGARALAHAGFLEDTPSDAFVARLAESGIYVVSTLSATDVHLTAFEPERLERPLVARVVPALEQATARDPRARDVLAEGAVAWVAPWLPRMWRPLLWRTFVRESRLRRRLAHQQTLLARLHAAGVRLVAGSDAPGFDDVPYHFHGPATLDEIALLRAAGLPAWAALQAATRVPAEMLGLAEEIGTVEVGKRADLVLVEGDPLAEADALARVRWVVRAGEARSPGRWLAR